MTTAEPDDWDDDDQDLDFTMPRNLGHAAVLCFNPNRMIAASWFDTLDEALAATGCQVEGCVGVHSAAARDVRGELRVIPLGDDVDPEALWDRLRQEARDHRDRVSDLYRAAWRASQRKLGLLDDDDQEDTGERSD